MLKPNSGVVTQNNTKGRLSNTEWNLREWMRGVNFKPEELTRGYYYSKISRLAINEFAYEVKNLHNPELIEYYLWVDSRVMIWKNKILGWIVTRCVETAWDINGFAVRWRPVYDMRNADLPEPMEMGLDDDCVVIYDIYNRKFSSNICCKWINEIADINETIRSQVFNQKTPLIVLAKNPKDKEKIKKAVIDIANNVRALFLDDDVNISSNMRALAIDAPFNISDLQAYLKCKESEMLEFLGIDSLSGFEKKERLITDEQESNNQTLSYLIKDRYESRVKGCERLREKGLDISVSLTVTFAPNDSDNEISEDSEDGENQTV